MRISAATSVLLAALGGCGGGEPARLYRTASGLMQTADGRALMLRSMNVTGAAKTAPGYLADLGQADVDILKQSGVNSVRMLTFWRAVTPNLPGEIDQGYLDRFVKQLRMFTDAGLYVVVDMHQDLWGYPFAEHGAPHWACPTELTQGYQRQSPWWVNYSSAQVKACFDNFWADVTLQDRFAQAWGAVAKAVCSERKVVGFDLINEPYPGSQIGRTDFDNAVLMPFYERVIRAVEEACPGRLYFLEPSASFVLGVATTMDIPAHLTDRVVFSGHFYPAEVHEPGGAGYDLDRGALESDILEMARPYLERGIPVWIGEYGGFTTSPNFDAYIRDLHSIFAAHNISSGYWDYTKSDGSFSFLDAAGSLKDVFKDVFMAPAATLVPGSPAQTPNWGERRLDVSFDCKSGQTLEVLLPATGCTCSVTPTGAVAPVPQGPGIATGICAQAGRVSLSCDC